MMILEAPIPPLFGEIVLIRRRKFERGVPGALDRAGLRPAYRVIVLSIVWITSILFALTIPELLG